MFDCVYLRKLHDYTGVHVFPVVMLKCFNVYFTVEEGEEEEAIEETGDMDTDSEEEATQVDHMEHWPYYPLGNIFYGPYCPLGNILYGPYCPLGNIFYWSHCPLGNILHQLHLSLWINCSGSISIGNPRSYPQKSKVDQWISQVGTWSCRLSNPCLNIKISQFQYYMSHINGYSWIICECV